MKAAACCRLVCLYLAWTVYVDQSKYSIFVLCHKVVPRCTVISWVRTHLKFVTLFEPTYRSIGPWTDQVEPVHDLSVHPARGAARCRLNTLRPSKCPEFMENQWKMCQYIEYIILFLWVIGGSDILDDDPHDHFEMRWNHQLDKAASHRKGRRSPDHLPKLHSNPHKVFILFVANNVNPGLINPKRLFNWGYHFSIGLWLWYYLRST